MKTIKLEQTTEIHSGHELNFSDQKLLLEILDMPVEKITFIQMRDRLKLMNKIEAASEEITLEDEEFSVIKNQVENFQFGIVSKHVLKLCEKFTG